MANRLRGYEISRPQPIIEPSPEPNRTPQRAPRPPTSASNRTEDALPWPPSATRPLSDIRELTEPSLIQDVATHVRQRRSISRSSSMKRKDTAPRKSSSLRRAESDKKRDAQYTVTKSYDASSSAYSSTPPELPGAYTIPQASIPKRSSSFGERTRTARGHVRKESVRDLPRPPPLPPPPVLSIPNRGHSRSPVKEAKLRIDPITSDVARRVPSRTVIRNPQPADILDFPSYKHPRLKLEIQATAPVFVGGGSVEGFVKVTVDDNERLKQRRTLGLGALSVDVLGFEEVNGNRRAIFLSLGTELIDSKHPPPANMIEPSNPLTPGDKFWTLSPSTSALPFMVSLPLDTGPPPFHSKQANIRFILCGTALIRDAGSHYRVRTTQEVQILPTYDPEKALTSLPSPLTAADELRMPKAGACETLKVTAGLHRQVWVSGSTVFVDVHIANKTRKHVKRLDLSLERDILGYKHAAAATREKSAGQARIFESNNQSMVTMSTLRAGTNGWSGVDPHSSDTRTCDLELPRGHATIRCGKYFEVRYFLNVTVSVSNTKLVTLQLPIILIHMNSLDVVPNSVAQVAAAIEEKRAHRHHRRRSSDTKPSTRATHRRGRSISSPARAQSVRRKPSYTQGRAFAAPRQQSLDRQRAERADIDHLRNLLDSSPRKHAAQLHGFTLRKVASNVSLGGRSVGHDSAFRAMAFRTPDTKHELHQPSSEAEGVDSIRERMKRMRSFDSFGSRKSPITPKSAFGPWQENVKPPPPPVPPVPSMPIRHQIEPHTLGLTNMTHISRQQFEVMGMEQVAKPGGEQSFRERIDRNRFEFKSVRRKPSGSMKDRGKNIWQHLKHGGSDGQKEREGWI
jgi:hypothetical protein